MPRRKVPIVPDEFYHVYNRGVNREPIFFERENYFFFLRTLRQFVVLSDQDAPSGLVAGESNPREASDPAARSARVALRSRNDRMSNHAPERRPHRSG